jgi:hypothetical protein
VAQLLYGAEDRLHAGLHCGQLAGEQHHWQQHHWHRHTKRYTITNGRSNTTNTTTTTGGGLPDQVQHGS